MLSLGWSLVRCQDQRRSSGRNSGGNLSGEQAGGAGKGRGFSHHPFATCPRREPGLGKSRPVDLGGAADTQLSPSPAASLHSPLCCLRWETTSLGHNQHWELGVRSPCAPVLQLLITEPSLGLVELSSPWNRILLARLPLCSTAVLFFALHLQISARTTISKQICSKCMAGLEIWKNPWQIFASLHHEPHEYFA